MPDIKFKTRDEIPEGLKGTEKEADGGFVVKVVAQSKLDEFRDNNLAIARERDEYKNKVTAYAALGDDPAKLADELSALRTVDQSVKDGKLKGSDAIAAEVSARLKAQEDGYKTQIGNLTKERDAAAAARAESDAKFKRSIIDRAVTEAVLAKDSGLNPAALPDILTRAYGTYVVGDGDKLVAKNGDTIIYGADGVNPMQPNEWLKKLGESAPHFLKPSAGGGAAGSEGSGKFAGMSQEAFLKLSPSERITKYREAGGK